MAVIRDPADASNAQGYDHSAATVETMKAWFDWVYKRKNIARPSMKLIRATKRNGPRVYLRVDYVDKDKGYADITISDHDAPRLIRDFARFIVMQCPDFPPFDPEGYIS